jgi:hypothetical protein
MSDDGLVMKTIKVNKLLKIKMFLKIVELFVRIIVNPKIIPKVKLLVRSKFFSNDIAKLRIICENKCCSVNDAELFDNVCD